MTGGQHYFRSASLSSLLTSPHVAKRLFKKTFSGSIWGEAQAEIDRFFRILTIKRCWWHNGYWEPAIKQPAVNK